jgi:hypothetical protein
MRGLIALAGLAALLAGCGSRGGDLPGDTAIAGAPDCGKKPAFVPLQADAKVLVCSVSHETRKDSGTVIYTSAATPAALLASVKDTAIKAGLEETLSTPETFSASQGERRSVMVTVAPKAAGSQVTMMWSRER